jgi:hypothetical protein
LGIYLNAFLRNYCLPVVFVHGHSPKSSHNASQFKS